MTDLPDINVWLALSSESHQCRDNAKLYWERQASHRIAFCTVTMLGLVRLAMNRDAMSGSPLTPEGAWQLFKSWKGLPEVSYIQEPRTCINAVQRRIEQGLVTPRTWTDSYLAALAEESNARLITFDQDFKRFPGLNVLILD